jgi:hypothetical protein
VRLPWRRQHHPVEVLSLQPGDVLAVHFEPRGRSDEQLDVICAAVKAMVPDGVKVMVFEGAKLAVLRNGDRP